MSDLINSQAQEGGQPMSAETQTVIITDACSTSQKRGTGLKKLFGAVVKLGGEITVSDNL